MATNNIIVKDATKEKAEFVEQYYKEIIKCKPGTTNIAGRIIKRLKNTFIVI